MNKPDIVFSPEMKWHEQIKAARVKVKPKLTQKAIAEKVDIDERQYRRIEAGTSFEIKTILKICEVLNIKITLPEN